MIEAYPLHWPVGYHRTHLPARNRHFKQSDLGKVRDLLLQELRRMGATQIIISTNIPLRQDGLPYAKFARMDITDKGVAVYFNMYSQQVVLCCDAWDRWEDNFYALCKAVEALRGLERWGVSEIMKRTFSGFKALPESTTTSRAWWLVLGLGPDASKDEIKAAYRSIAQVVHPDKPTGSKEAFQELNNAYITALNQ